MRIKSQNKEQSPLIVDRTQRSLNHALSVLRSSDIAKCIKHVYMYGSCARQEQTYGSDVDLFVELDANTDRDHYHSELIRLRGDVSPVINNLPDVDLHFTYGEDWKKDGQIYHENIKKEGIDVWSM